MDGVKVDELPIGYAEGKTIDREKGTVLKNLSMLSILSNDILRTGKLSDEMSLLLTVQEIDRGVDDIALSLLDLKLNDKDATKVMGWSGSLSKISNGPGNSFFLDSLAYVTRHADEVQDGRCPAN